MKKTIVALLIIGIILMISGVVLINFNGLPFNMGMNSYNNFDIDNFNKGEKLSIEEIEENVNDYISQFNNNLEISDIFIFEKTDYYFSIMESDTERGAMELLVDPYSGNIYPEYGPNMMWNIKYGMHGGNRFGMMGMRNWFSNDDSYEDLDEIDREDAVAIANSYINRNIGNEYFAGEEGHKFYGYYTFHIESPQKTVGMLSVNLYSGEVWYHDWHDEVVEVIMINEEH